MTRDEKIRYIREGILEHEGAILAADHFDDWTEEDINEELEFIEFLRTEKEV